MSKLICKCCGNEARWCGEGSEACGYKYCDHIHCDHCGMHYALESKAASKVANLKEGKKLMLKAYIGNGKL